MDSQWIVSLKIDSKGIICVTEYYLREEKDGQLVRYAKSTETPKCLRVPTIKETVERDWKQWINELGAKSAVSQKFKEPITSISKFILDPLKVYPTAYPKEDYIFLLISVDCQKNLKSHTACSSGSNSGDSNESELTVEPIGFIRVGDRKLYFAKDDNMVEVDRCFSVLGKLIIEDFF